MAVIKMMTVLLLVAYVSAADFDTVYGKFNDTIRGKCKADAATATATTASGTGQTPAPTGTGATGPTTTVAPAPTDSTTEASTTPKVPATSHSRKKRAATDTNPCETQEQNVLATKNLDDFKTNLNLFYTCQKEKCKSLTADVDQLIKDSGASAVKVCGLLMVLLIAMSYFG